MSEDKKTRKRKILFRYLILAACLLVVAAITVTVVFAANDWFRSDVTIEKPDDNKPDDNKPDDNKPGDNTPDEPDKPTHVETTFAKPVSTLNVTTVHEFCANPSLYGKWLFHEGIDVAAEKGEAVSCCLDGTVEDITESYLEGTTITVSHANGIKTKYRYVDVKSGLKKGDSVKRGETIGTVAEPTGDEFRQSAHLHFEVLENGEQKDPAPYLDIAEK